MKFWQFLRFTDPVQLLPLAQVVEDAGFHGLMLGDHVIFPEEVNSEYPYHTTGKPFWDPETPWPDPFSAIGAMAAVTRRIHFSTNVYVLPMHNPFDVARALATLSLMSNGRIELGCGGGWNKEEFDAMGVEFSTRGKRYTEMVEIMRLLWSGEMTEYHGEIFDFPRLQMSPRPDIVPPLLMAGDAKPAMRRAATLGDGWVTGNFSLKNLPDKIAAVRTLREEAGLAEKPFRILASVNEVKVDIYKRLEDMGVTDILNLPLIEEIGPKASQDEKADYIRRFADSYLRAFD